MSQKPRWKTVAMLLGILVGIIIIGAILVPIAAENRAETALYRYETHWGLCSYYFNDYHLEGASVTLIDVRYCNEEYAERVVIVTGRKSVLIEEQ